MRYDYALGELPADLSPLARFRPADQLDFGRRAKSLAELLDQPLQQAQELLARIYGYAHLHELQQVLKTEGAPGPYDDALMEIAGVMDRDAAVPLRYFRAMRLMRHIQEWMNSQKHRYWEDADYLACDLGLFASPSAHRLAVKGVKQFREMRKGTTLDGFPYGYRGILIGRYLVPIPLDYAAMDAFAPMGSEVEHRRNRFDSRHQLHRLRVRRAAELFLEMMRLAAPEVLDLPSEIPLEFGWLDHTDQDRMLLSDFDSWIAEALMPEDDQSDHTTSETAGQGAGISLETVLADPSDRNIAGCAYTGGIDDFRAKLAHWRLVMRCEQARFYQTVDLCEFDADYFETVAVVWESNDLCIELGRSYGESGFAWWDVSATYFAHDQASGKWVPVGSLQGDFCNPVENGKYLPPNEPLMMFDDRGDREMYRVWTILQRDYFARADFDSYHEWINNEESFSFAPAVANITPWIAPLFRGKGHLAIMLKSFVDAFQEGNADTWDVRWKDWIDPERPEDAYYEEREYPFPEIAVMFIPLHGTGTLGFSIWDGGEEAQTSLVRHQGVRRRRRPQMPNLGRSRAPERGLVPHILNTVKTLNTDVVIYDPDGAAAKQSEETAEDGD